MHSVGVGFKINDLLHLSAVRYGKLFHLPSACDISHHISQTRIRSLIYFEAHTHAMHRKLQPSALQSSIQLGIRSLEEPGKYDRSYDRGMEQVK